ncbi:MAG: hypothetical protein ACRDTJ_16370 [Pseudonocardiaceae bacterium]
MSTHLTIGDLVDLLKAAPQDLPVYADNKRPSALLSYRGYYSDLAIDTDEEARHDKTRLPARPRDFSGYLPGHHKVQIADAPLVSDLVKALGLALYEEFEGYKGGQYEMTDRTDVWVSGYGDASGRYVTAVEVLADRVDVIANTEEW